MSTLFRTHDWQCGYLLQRASPPTEEDIDENWLLGYEWRDLSANQRRDAASTSPASLTLLAVLWRVRVCSDINDCWGDGGASMWSAWHLIEGRDAPSTAAVKTEREGHREHMNVSPTCFRTPLRFFVFPHAEAVCCAVEETLELISHQLRKK